MQTKFFGTIVKTIFTYLLRAIYVQIAISFVYTPILIYWGLPISLMSVVGNLLFTPFFIYFIANSFFIFITQLLHIPNQMLCESLNFITLVWLKIIALGSPTWLMGFAYPGILPLLLFILTGGTIFWCIRSWNLLWRTTMMTGLFICQLGLLRLTTQPPLQTTITYGNEPVHIINNNGTLTLSIPPIRSSGKNFGHWFTHTAQQELRRTFGHCNIGNVILVNPTHHTVEVIEENKDIIGYQKIELITSPSIA
jgi:hypothetical protein